MAPRIPLDTCYIDSYMSKKKTVVIGLLGTQLDAGRADKRWDRWRPTVGLCQQDDLLVDRLELIHDARGAALAATIVEDIGIISPETIVRPHVIELRDAWDFAGVYAALHDFASSYRFDLEREEYLVHITTGTHVVQICLFLLTESRHFPAKLVQTSPAREDVAGKVTIIDLDLTRYAQLASRFEREQDESRTFLKAGIETRNARFNATIEEMERVVLASREPMLLLGPTGSGKSQLARRTYDLLRTKRLVEGPWVEVNCATLRGDTAASTLFGHERGAFTGAQSARRGLLVAADTGVLFLDEIGELGLDEQAMLLSAIETKRFRPVGSDKEASSDFRLITGTNRDLRAAVRAGRFREDLLARIDLWCFALPALRDRPEDIAPNLDFELDRAALRLGRKIVLRQDARKAYLEFARSPAATWPGNFRDLGASVLRMATLAHAGVIDRDDVAHEVGRLARAFGAERADGEDRVARVLGPGASLDRFDRVQLDDVLAVCGDAPSLAAAGRVLFAVSRAKKASTNDADRLRKYLARFDLDLERVHAALEP